MKRVSILLLCMVIAGPPLFAQSASDAKEFERLEKVWNQAHINGDSAALESLWADDLEVVVPKMPVMTKSDVLAFAKSGRMHFQRYETSDLKVRLYGDVAIVSGRLQRTRSINGKQLDDDWRFTKVYARQDAQWRVVTFHASEAVLD